MLRPACRRRVGISIPALCRLRPRADLQCGTPGRRNPSLKWRLAGRAGCRTRREGARASAKSDRLLRHECCGSLASSGRPHPAPGLLRRGDRPGRLLAGGRSFRCGCLRKDCEREPGTRASATAASSTTASSTSASGTRASATTASGTLVSSTWRAPGCAAPGRAAPVMSPPFRRQFGVSGAALVVLPCANGWAPA